MEGSVAADGSAWSPFGHFSGRRSGSGRSLDAPSSILAPFPSTLHSKLHSGSVSVAVFFADVTFQDSCLATQTCRFLSVGEQGETEAAVTLRKRAEVRKTGVKAALDRRCCFCSFLTKHKQ